MSNNVTQSFKLEPCNGVILRTPILPLKSMLDASASDIPSVNQGDTHFDIRKILSQPLVYNAIWISSSNLANELDRLLSGKQILSDDFTISLIKYITRMTTRATPFGLMAASSYVNFDKDYNNRKVATNDNVFIASHIDSMLVAHFREVIKNYCREQSIDSIRVVANSTWYRLGEIVRYYHMSDSDAQSHNATLEELYLTDAIQLVIENSRDLTPIYKISNIVSYAFNKSYVDTVKFIYKLIGKGLLLTEVDPIVTTLDDSSRLFDIADQLNLPITPFTNAMRALHGATASQGPRSATIVANFIRVSHDHQDAWPKDLRSLVHVNAIRPTPPAGTYCSRSSVTALGSALSEVLAVAQRPDPYYDRLIDSFRTRFGDAEVPLLKFLDPDFGLPALSFGVSNSEFIGDLAFIERSSADPPKSTNLRDYPFTSEIASTSRSQEEEMVIGRGMLESARSHRVYEHTHAEPLPRTMAVSGFFNCDQSEFEIHGMWLASAVSVLGRFSSLSDEIGSLCGELVETETDPADSAITADIVFDPGGKPGNVVRRASTFQYEIELNSGLSRFTGKFKVPANELSVYVFGDHFVLWSRALNKEVVPVLSNAHNTASHLSPVYNFLGLIHRGRTIYGLLKPPSRLLDELGYHPRIRYRSIILAPKAWSLDPRTVHDIKNTNSKGRADALRAALAQRGCLERCVRFGDHDVISHYDLKSSVQCDAIIQQMKPGRFAHIYEACHQVRDAFALPIGDDRYVSEYVIPFKVSQHKNSFASRIRSPQYPQYSIRKATHLPFDEWLYFKLYIGAGLADRFLVQHVRPLIDSLREGDAITSWFFIRYYDERGQHIRLRLKFPSNSDGLLVNARCVEAWKRAIYSDAITGYCLAPYDLELRRYGGVESLQICESLFGANSEFVLAILEGVGTPHMHTERGWMWHVWWIYSLLCAFGMDDSSIAKFSHVRMQSLRDELVQSKTVRRHLLTSLVRERFDTYREGIGEITELCKGNNKMLGIINLRDQFAHKLTTVLSRADQIRILGSIIHMDTNRFFMANQRISEMIMYATLGKYSESHLHRELKT